MNEMLEIQPPEGFSWYGYHAYKAFDMFLESVVLQRKSFISREEIPLEIENALNDIRALRIILPPQWGELVR